MRYIFLVSSLIILMPVVSKALCISYDNVSLRSKPDAKAKVTWVVGKNMPLVQVEKKGAWIRVKDFEGEKHWVHARNVNSRVNCVVVKARTANLRLGPGTKFASTDLGFVKKYATFQKVGRDEEWLKVQDGYGQIHWAHEKTLWEPRNYSRVSF